MTHANEPGADNVVSIDAPLMRYHGGKFRLAPWIIAHFPEHQTYVEPYGGAASVLVQKAPAPHEVYNDLDDDVVNVFRLLREPGTAAELARLCELTPYARAEHELAQQPASEPLERARRTLFRAWAGFGSAGATKGRSGMRTFTGAESRYKPVSESWTRAAALIPRFAQRLRHVIIENRPALEVMRDHDGRATLHYVDPPYLPETRTIGSTRYYRHEMAPAEHQALLSTLQDLEGMVVLSGYDSPLYGDALSGWHQTSRYAAASSRHGSVKRMECLWLNPAAAQHAKQMALFG